MKSYKAAIKEGTGMKKNRLSISILILFLVLFGGGLIIINLEAGPTIIRDNRIYDLAATPALGRGYSISTNTFQSTCMKNVKITEPSYDFDYTFESIEDMRSTRQSSTVSGSLDIGISMFNLKSSGSSTTVEGVTLFYHNVRVEINMDTYYASVDESKTELSDAAKTLLLNNDIPGFFHSCGSYYVRSIGRNAKFVSIFTYMDERRERNTEFELQLELAIKGFGASLLKTMGASVGMSANIKKSFESVAQKKRLTITTKAWGLGKNRNATLIAYDLDTYKAAIKEAFISMQNPMTGRVSTMEIVPWVENAVFQNHIKLEEDVVDEASKEKLLLYEKKHILNLNAEFLARLERTERLMIDIYYKALICKQIIDSNWKRDGKFTDDAAKLKIQNNRNSRTIRLGELDSHLTQEKIDQLLQNESDFMYSEEGAAKCMKQIMRNGIFKKSWRDILVCKNLRTKLATRMNETIDDYCMPRIAKTKKK
ncbi:MAG: hypothetical protein GY754_27155 [bacterium]|nr:hypothetical protein [bacterium]